MLSFKGLKKLKVRAADGQVGAVKDVAFDNHSFVVRQLLIRSGPWWGRQTFILNPFTVTEVHFARKEIRTVRRFIDLSREEPDAPMVPARDMVIFGGVAINPLEAEFDLSPAGRPLSVRALSPSLTSSRNLMLYEAHARDGYIGRVSELIFDVEAWRLRYVVIKTGWSFGGRKVMCPVESLDEISSHRAVIFFSLRRYHIEEAPDYVARNPVTKAVEERDYDFCGDPQGFEVRQVSVENSAVGRILQKEVSKRWKVS